MQQVYLSWHDFEELMSRIIFKLNTPYDAILTIARGGIIPGGMIAEALKMKNVLTTAIDMPEDPNLRSKISWPRFQHFPPEEQITGRKILVVDNLWNQGRTIMAVKGRIETAGGYPELAVVHWKPESSYFPDDEPEYYGEITDDFIHYPWQRIDDSDYRILARPVMPLS